MQQQNDIIHLFVQCCPESILKNVKYVVVDKQAFPFHHLSILPAQGDIIIWSSETGVEQVSAYYLVQVKTKQLGAAFADLSQSAEGWGWKVKGEHQCSMAPRINESLQKMPKYTKANAWPLSDKTSTDSYKWQATRSIEGGCWWQSPGDCPVTWARDVV